MSLPSTTFRLALGLLLILILGNFEFAHAQQQTKLSVSPVTFELTADPGDTLTNQIKVTNASDSELQLETKVENIAGTGDQGQVQLTDAETSFSLSKWVTSDAPRFKLAANESRLINFTIRVPHNAEPGGHYGSILVGTIASDTPGVTGVGFGQKIGSLLLVKVSGQAKESAVFTSLAPKQFTGEWDERTAADGKTKILVARTNDFQSAKTQRYFDHGPIAFVLTVSNLGNVHIKPSGFITIYNIFQQKVAELPIDSRNVFPGNDRQIAVIWPAKQLWGGYYRAEATAVYGATNQPMTVHTNLWVFPKVAAIVIGLIILILLLLHKRLIKATRILIKGS